jgi:hypothetical protein
VIPKGQDLFSLLPLLLLLVEKEAKKQKIAFELFFLFLLEMYVLEKNV